MLLDELRDVLFTPTIVELAFDSAYSVAVRPARNCLILLLLATIAGAACRRSSRDGAEPSTVEQLVLNPESYAHRLVTVRGCYVSSFERTTLQPCENAQHDQMVWVESAEMLQTLDQSSIPALPSAAPKELRSGEESLLVFEYDEARSRAAWKKLESASAASAYRLEVTVIGQFETISPKQSQPLKVGFGHLNAYQHSLILVDVLQSKSPVTVQ